MRLHQWLNWNLRVLFEGTTLREALRGLERWNVSGLPVVDPRGKGIGYLSQTGANSWIRREGREGLVEEAMTPFLMALPPQAPLVDALALMWECRIHRVLSLDEEGRPVGVMTTGDVLRKALASESLQAWLEMPVGEVMVSPVHRVSSDYHLSFFVELCDYHRISGAPVVESGSGQLVGHISQPDVARLLWSTERPLSHYLVLDAMTACCHTCSPEATLGSAIQQLVDYGIHRLVVAQEQRPVGIVTALDLMYVLWRELQLQYQTVPLERVRRKRASPGVGDSLLTG